MLVRFEKIKHSFGAIDVLEDATFQINPGDRIGLIGRNGSGKTTLLRLIAGELEREGGTILRSQQLQVSYLEQLVHAESTETVLGAAENVLAHFVSQEQEIEMLNQRISKSEFAGTRSDDLARLSDLLHQFELHGGYSFRARVEQVLMGLGFTRDDFSRSCAEISGGQMNRLNLARLLLGEPNLLLLDEPTNHLDLDAVSWLEEFLREYRHAFLVVSHDRYFLNRVVSRIFELERGAVQSYGGDYSAYQKQKALRLEQESKAYEQQQQWIQKTEDFVRRNIAGQKTKQAKSRRKMLAKVERLDRPGVSDEAAHFDFHVTLPSAHRVFQVERGTIGYNSEPIVGEIEFKLFRGDRYGIIGKNGTGKSTFLKTLGGQIRKISGSWIVGERVHFGIYDQRLENLNPSKTVMEELHQLVPMATQEEIRSFAARFLFKGDEVFQTVANLSGGEKSRLSLAKLICQKPNVLLLDEPTNHLDIASREALETALSEYDGTLLVVTHDRYLLERLVSRLLVFEAGRMKLFDGTYSGFVRERMSEKTLATTSGVKDFGERKPVDMRGERLSLVDVPGKESSEPRPPKRANTNRERQRVLDLIRLEDEIAKTEVELRDVEARLADTVNYADLDGIKKLSESHQSITEQLNRLYQQWETEEANPKHQDPIRHGGPDSK